MSNLEFDGYTIDEDIETILRHVKSELTNGKLSYIQRKGDNVRVTCPVSSHSGGKETNPDCNVYCAHSDDLQYGWFRCFACGTQGPLYSFVAHCFDSSEAYAKKWLIDNYGKKISNNVISLDSIDLTSKKKNDIIEETILDKYQSYHPYLQQRGISRHICEQFKVKYDTETKTIVFPVYDEYNKLVMLTRRSTERKMFLIPPDVEKPVYLLNEINKRGIKTVFVCESQFNALTCWEYGYPAVALFGTGTSHQYDILNKSCIRHYILCLDGDEAGRKGTNKLLKNLRHDVFIDVVNMPSNKDVNDCSKEEFEKILKNNNIEC